MLWPTGGRREITHTHTSQLAQDLKFEQEIKAQQEREREREKQKQKEEKKSCLQEVLRVQLERITLRCMNLIPCACSYLIMRIFVYSTTFTKFINVSQLHYLWRISTLEPERKVNVTVCQI